MPDSSQDIAQRDDHHPVGTRDAAGPQVEILSRPAGPSTVKTPLRHSGRFKLFALVFLLVLGAGSAWNFSRPPLYRAVATTLVEVPEGIGFSAGEDGADTQNVAVQGRILLARDLLADTLERAVRQNSSLAGLDPDSLRNMLDVQSTPETNLVEMGATGGDPEQLAALVNAWTEAYLARRQSQVESDVDQTLARLQEEYDRLDASKREKAAELNDYRERNDIDTMESEGNQALARLNALTAELNKARAEQVKAEAEQSALEEAIARGEPVVPQSEKGDLVALESKADELRNRLAELEKRYTAVYLNNEPTLRDLPGELRSLDENIARLKAEGREYLRSTARRDLERARRQVQVQEQQLAVARSEASRFTARYARYETLKQDLEKLDELHRELEGRLVEIKAKAPERYAQVKVIEPAFVPRTPIQPDYWRDFLYTLAAAGLSALLAVLLVEFLSRRTRDEDDALPVTGVRVFAPMAAGVSGETVERLADQSPESIAQAETPSLPGSILRELLIGEVRALTELADPATRQLIGLLLCGLTPQECADLAEADFDLDAGLVRAPGEGRSLALGPELVSHLASHRPLPLWSGASGSAGVDGLSTRIGLLAHDAGLAHPAEIGVGALRHTYICYLVRQGARLTEIEQVIGRVPAGELSRYAAYRPSGPAKPLSDLDLVYPSFAGSA